MEKFVYPAVLSSEENLYVISFQDLDLAVVGNSIEETYLRAAESLQAYLEFASKFEFDAPAASLVDEAKMLNPKSNVQLVHATIEKSKCKLTPQDNLYKNFIQSMIE